MMGVGGARFPGVVECRVAWWSRIARPSSEGVPDHFSHPVSTQDFRSFQACPKDVGAPLRAHFVSPAAILSPQ